MDKRYDNLYAKLPHATITSLFKDSSNIWFGSWDNVLYCYNTVTQTETVFKQDSTPFSFPNDEAQSFAADKKGRLWIGGKHYGLTVYDKQEKKFFRGSNRAGGLEGGITNGEDVLVRGLLKPISTLRRPLESVDLESREPVLAAYERSDVAVVPAAGVIGEAMVALVIAQAFLEKFGGDSLGETRRNYEGYAAQVKNY